MPTTSRRPCAGCATPHPAAAAAALDILRRGGNAVDAAVAAILACCVAMPGAVGIGGYGGSMIAFLARLGKVVALDFDSRAPFAYSPGTFSRRDLETGYRSVTVPAVIAGLELALQQFGTLSWAIVSAPAIDLATTGVPVSAELHSQLDDWAARTDAVSRRALFPDGRIPSAGAAWAQPDLAQLLRRLAEEGPNAFYRGAIPKLIVALVREHGGILSEEDFERYRPRRTEPLAIAYRGYQVATPPPPSGGLTSLQILKILEQLGAMPAPAWGSAYFHLFAEAAKLAWQDRSACFGDPDVVSIPVPHLLSNEAARERAARIRRDCCLSVSGRTPASPPHTVNVVTGDREGNIVSLTATHGNLYGSNVAIDGLGLILGHGMSRFDVDDASPNAAAPGKRMFHNMAPTLILDSNGQPRAALGLPGGTKIVTVTAQLVVSLIDFGACAAAAVAAPRVHVETQEPIAVSSALPDTVAAELQALGHTVVRGQDIGGPPAEIGGSANVLLIDSTSGTMSVAAQASPAATGIIGVDANDRG